jgi:large subunit ribosomal protein L9
MSSVVEVILVRDIPGLGRLGQKRKVKSGYARNFLLPQGFAMPANEQNEARLETIKKREASRIASEKAAAEEVGEKLKELTLYFTQKTHDGGKLYGSIGATELAQEILKKTGVDLEKKQILLEAPLKTTGEFKIKLYLHFDVQVVVTVDIQEEKE